MALQEIRSERDIPKGIQRIAIVINKSTDIEYQLVEKYIDDRKKIKITQLPSAIITESEFPLAAATRALNEGNQQKTLHFMGICLYFEASIKKAIYVYETKGPGIEKQPISDKVNPVDLTLISIELSRSVTNMSKALIEYFVRSSNSAAS